MRESDHDCGQSYEDFIYADDDVDGTLPGSENTKPATETVDAVESVEAVDRKRESGLDSLGGGMVL
ncbi:hypothetical protein PS903_06131 [Pseudomonas fluorescens]|nr:hypothetical protein PS903_06131 [Pseudomonas fluorescens]